VIGFHWLLTTIAHLETNLQDTREPLVNSERISCFNKFLMLGGIARQVALLQDFLV